MTNKIDEIVGQARKNIEVLKMCLEECEERAASGDDDKISRATLLGTICMLSANLPSIFLEKMKNSEPIQATPAMEMIDLAMVYLERENNL